MDIREMSKIIQDKILKQMYPILEELIGEIANGENLEKEDLIKKYLGGLKEYKKKRTRQKGLVNAYSMFLSDKDINEKIIKENPDSNFGERSKIKGKMWHELPTQEKEKYKTMAKELNEKKNTKDDKKE